MSDAPQWDKCSVWLGSRLNREQDFAKNIVREADAAGFTRAELAAAYTAIGAQTTANDCWELDAGKRAYSPAAAGAGPGFSAADQVGAVLRERARCEAIICCEAAQGRTALARHYAFKTGDTLADVVKALASMPLESSLRTAGSAPPAHVSLPVPVAAVVAPIISAGKAPGPAAKPKHETAADVYARRRHQSGRGG